MSRPKGSKNKPKEMPVKQQAPPPPPSPPAPVSQPKRGRPKKGELPPPPPAVVVQQEPPKEPPMKVKFLDFQYLETVSPDHIAMSFKKNGVEVCISANEEDQTVKLALYHISKEALTEKQRNMEAVFKFDEFVSFIKMMPEAEVTSIKEKKIKEKFKHANVRV